MTREDELRERVDYPSDPHTRLKHAFYRRSDPSGIVDDQHLAQGHDRTPPGREPLVIP